MNGPELLLALVPLFIIVDPFASLGLFLGLTTRRTNRQRVRIALKASAFAAVVLLLFAAGGKQFLSLLGIEIYALQAAGGLLLTMIGLRMLREGREIPQREIHLPTGGRHDTEDPEGDPSFVPLGLPMLAGPGAISLVIVQTTELGTLTVAAAVLLVMAVSVLVLLAAVPLQARLGDTGSRVITRIMGILTVAFAAQYLFDGIAGWRAGLA
jgi:multiple antibiotic resistance protein